MKQFINEMKNLLEKDSHLTLESFMLSDDSEMDHSEERPVIPQDKREPSSLPPVKSDETSMSSIRAEINQIRQIALKAIARLAEYPSSEPYIMMKKVWNMCDKAMEDPSKNEDFSKEERF